MTATDALLGLEPEKVSAPRASDAGKSARVTPFQEDPRVASGFVSSRRGVSAVHRPFP